MILILLPGTVTSSRYHHSHTHTNCLHTLVPAWSTFFQVFPWCQAWLFMACTTWQLGYLQLLPNPNWLLLPIYVKYSIISCEKYWHSTISTIRFYKYSKYIEERPKMGRAIGTKFFSFLGNRYQCEVLNHGQSLENHMQELHIKNIKYDVGYIESVLCKLFGTIAQSSYIKTSTTASIIFYCWIYNIDKINNIDNQMAFKLVIHLKSNQRRMSKLGSTQGVNWSVYRKEWQSDTW